jgi:hypothetical protein
LVLVLLIYRSSVSENKKPRAYCRRIPLRVFGGGVFGIYS